MRRLLSAIAVTVVVVAILLVVTVAAFDRLLVMPASVKAQAALALATTSERKLPAVVKQALARSHGTRLKYWIARQLLSAPPNQIEGMKTASRQFTELGVGLLLPLHLNTEELLSLAASQAYMGPGVQGFEQAAVTYFGLPLARVSNIQAAKLVAIARAPSAYINSPERLERHAQELLTQEE